jgi:hypothetical protein
VDGSSAIHGLQTSPAFCHISGMKLRCMLLAFLGLMIGCNQQKQRDLRAEIVADANKHLEKADIIVGRLNRVGELTPPHEVATSLRIFTREIQQWHRDYIILRTKMAAHEVPREQQTESTKRYKETVENVRAKVAQTEHRLTKRSDGRFFYMDLQRLRNVVSEL